MTCPACGVAAPAGARFCPECGQRLVARPDERRVVTVLMADLVGFTAWSESADPEHVKRMVDHLFERLVADISDFGGRLDKIVGDEIVALFGAPVAHEDDAERAVRAALRMHETLATVAAELGTQVRMRVGINTGEVLVGAMRAGGEATVMGDVVNTAQRLQTTAAPGEVVVGAPTEAATRHAIRYADLGLLTVKGRDEPVAAHRALDTVSVPGRRRGPGRAPLVGRDAELGALTTVVQLALTRRRSHHVHIEGDAGVGKSRLATALAERARDDHGALVLAGQSVPYGDSNAFGPVAEAVRHHCETTGLPVAVDAQAELAECVADIMGDRASRSEVERFVEGLLHLVHAVTRPGVDPGRARDEAVRAAVAFLQIHARKSPVVLLLTDVHWSDDVVLDTVERILARLRDLPIVVVTTARPGDHQREHPRTGRHNSFVVHLDPLDADATAQLVRALLDDCTDADTVQTLIERSGGNPFFVEELVAYLRESATRPAAGSRDAPLLELPATLHGLVAARLDTLGAQARSLLEDCAVIGGSGSITTIAALAGTGTSPGDVKARLRELTERDLLTVDRDEFHFKSELIREIAYGTLTKAERARRHAHLAPLLTARGGAAADQVAHHLATAAELVQDIGPVPDVPATIVDDAVEALQGAARRAEGVDASLAAGHHHDRTLGLLGERTDHRRAAALLGRARARIVARALDAGREDAQSALVEAQVAGDRHAHAAALTLLGEIQRARSDYDDAERTLQEALARWRELDDASGIANTLRELGMSQLFRGSLGKAEHLIGDALASYRSVGDRRGEAWALQNLAWISFSRNDASEAEHRLRQSADLFGELGDWGGLGWAFGLLAFVRYMQGDLDEAAELAEQIAAEGHESGNRWAVGMMGVLLANVALWRGRTRECRARGHEAVALFRSIGDRWGEVQASGPLVRALAEHGPGAEYRAAVAELQDTASHLPDTGLRTMPWMISATVALQYGDPDEAAHALATIDRMEEAAGVEGTFGTVERASASGLLHAQCGEGERAVAVLEPAYAEAGTDGPALALGSRLALAYVTARRPQDARRVVEAARGRSGGTYNDRMLLLWAESLAHLQLGTGDARAPVDAAHAIATATDSPVQHAVAAKARALVHRALGLDVADEIDADASDQLDALGIDARGWTRLFHAAT